MPSGRKRGWTESLQDAGSFFVRHARRLLAAGFGTVRFYLERLFDGSLLNVLRAPPGEWPRRLFLILEVLEERRLPSGILPPGQGVDPPNHITALTGIPFAAPKGHDFSGPVAEFSAFTGTNTASYTANILWGDGSSSTGAISVLSGTSSKSAAAIPMRKKGPICPASRSKRPAWARWAMPRTTPWWCRWFRTQRLRTWPRSR